MNACLALREIPTFFILFSFLADFFFFEFVDTIVPHVPLYIRHCMWDWVSFDITSLANVYTQMYEISIMNIICNYAIVDT